VRTVLAAEQREKNIEAALRDVQRRERARAGELEALIDAVPAVVLVAHDAEARRITGNRAAAEMLRMPKDANMSKGALHDSPAHYRLLKDSKSPRRSRHRGDLASTQRRHPDWSMAAHGQWRAPADRRQGRGRSTATKR
jgi:PAS domain-containing protein